MPEKTKPFLFDQNDFNDHQVVIPVFSGDDLDLARRESVEAGRNAGLSEAKGLREKHIADLLSTVHDNVVRLFGAEAERNARFEAETLFLARGIFTKLFPGLNEREGLSEILRTIGLVLAGQRAQPELVIEIHPDYAGDIRDHLDGALRSVAAGICTIAGDAALGPGDCRLRWEDGGAARSATTLAAEIGRVFEQTLAGRALLRDNSLIEDASSAPPAQIVPVTEA